MYFIFPPHLTSASALPGEKGNPETASFHLNAACFFTNKSSAVAEMGDRLATIDMGRKVGRGCCGGWVPT